ncbi:MAG: glycosyltransferase family 2 protein [Candidatus Peribacteraceae bacterium]|nr:glycosyltransferase family 2 protein [Candidatus Peribacteraceae bacterium]
MTNRLPVSVHILTWNSSQTLERAVASVKHCAEILVIDGGSQDDTVAIAERLGARVLPQRFPGAQGKPLMDFAAARNVGLEQATQPWILALDSDEILSDGAVQEIHDIVTTSGPGPAAYWVPRRYLLEDGTVVTRASTYPNERLYFFRKDAVERWEKPVHERVKLKDGAIIGRLHDGSLAPLPPLSVFYSKLNQYLRIEVEQSRGTGWKRWLLRIIHTLKGRAVSFVRLLWIWLIPWTGKRLPLPYEIARFWYAWKLILMTCPPVIPSSSARSAERTEGPE